MHNRPNYFEKWWRLTFHFVLKSKIKRKKVKHHQHNKSEDEFSPTSAPISPVTPNGHYSFEAAPAAVAPLADQEDLEEDEKHETEATKETTAATEQILTVFISNFSYCVSSRDHGHAAGWGEEEDAEKVSILQASVSHH